MLWGVVGNLVRRFLCSASGASVQNLDQRNVLDLHNKPTSETTYWPVQAFVMRFEKELALLSEKESGEIILTSWD